MSFSRIVIILPPSGIPELHHMDFTAGIGGFSLEPLLDECPIGCNDGVGSQGPQLYHPDGTFVLHFRGHQSDCSCRGKVNKYSSLLYIDCEQESQYYGSFVFVKHSKTLANLAETAGSKNYRSGCTESFDQLTKRCHAVNCTEEDLELVKEHLQKHEERLFLYNQTWWDWLLEKYLSFQNQWVQSFNERGRLSG